MPKLEQCDGSFDFGLLGKREPRYTSFPLDNETLKPAPVRTETQIRNDAENKSI